jgi:hypothetical protein
MALRDQPYLPLYIQDFMTDEKLIECSAETTGVYIRLMCILHKSDEYGKILLKQKDKQSDKPLLNFASKIAKQMPFDFKVVERSLVELLDEKVLHIEGDFLLQKRMVKDNALSLVRSQAGKKGGEFAQAKVKAKVKANSEYEIDIVNEVKVEKKKGVQGEKAKTTAQLAFDLIPDTFHGDEFAVLWDDYEKLRKKKNKPLTETAVKQRVGQLVAISGGEWGIAKASMEETISSGWDRFFEVKPKTTQSGHDPRYSHSFVKDKA